MQSPLTPQLQSLIPKEGLILILGDIRMGKSCLGYGILESVSNPGKYVYGLPQKKRYLLPDFIEPIDTQEFPEGGAVLCDEAYISFYARSSMAAANKFMDLFAGLVGQKAILGIYVSQLSRKLDIGVVSAAKLLLIKCPSVLQMRLDRSELRDILRDAWEGFKVLNTPEGLSKVDWQKHCVYALCNDFEGMIEDSNSPPSFWSDELSRAFAGVSLSQGQGKLDDPSLVQFMIEKSPSQRGDNLQCLACERKTDYLISGVCYSCFVQWVLKAKKENHGNQCPSYNRHVH